jgi:hypothetical protein
MGRTGADAHQRGSGARSRWPDRQLGWLQHRNLGRLTRARARVHPEVVLRLGFPRLAFGAMGICQEFRPASHGSDLSRAAVHERLYAGDVGAVLGGEECRLARVVSGVPMRPSGMEAAADAFSSSVIRRSGKAGSRRVPGDQHVDPDVAPLEYYLVALFPFVRLPLAFGPMRHP